MLREHISHISSQICVQLQASSVLANGFCCPELSATYVFLSCQFPVISEIVFGLGDTLENEKQRNLRRPIDQQVLETRHVGRSNFLKSLVLYCCLSISLEYRFL
jgi:hypothetical protein